MNRILGCMALAHLTAAIWLGACTPALTALEPVSEGSFKPVEVAASKAAGAPDGPEPEVKARPRGSGNQGDFQEGPTINLPPKTAAAQVDRRSVKKSGKPEQMPPTQGYPPPPAQPAPGEDGAQAAPAAEKKRGRTEQRQVTTIELPKKQRTPQDRARSGRGSKSSEAAPVSQAPDPNQAALTAPATPGPERAGSRSKKQRRSRSAAPAPGPNQAALTAPDSPSPERAGSRSKKQRRSRLAAPAPDPNQAAVTAPVSPSPERAGSRSKKQRDSRSPASAQTLASALPTPPGPAVGLTPEREMTRAYQAFDLAYNSSLGKTRKELNMLWGFPLQKMGDNGVEVAYGFRQKGLLSLPEPAGKGPAGKKKAYYASSSIDPSLPGQYFTCLVVLWVDKKGRGVVVDGEAVGDCFLVETLSRTPDHFER